MKKVKKCSEAKLLDYLEGDLRVGEGQEIQHHLDECAFCAGRLKKLAVTFKLALRAQDEPLSPIFVRGLFYRIKQGIETRKKTAQTWGRPIALALGGALVVLLGTISSDKITLDPTLDPPDQGRETSLGELVLEGDFFEESDQGGGDEEMFLLITDYLLRTASTEELLKQMRTFDQQNDFMALLEDY